MVIAIHQPHFFPWLGYLDKMVEADSFVLLDQVQLEKGSQMIRNKVIDTNGEPKYITISADTTNYLNKKYNEINVKDVKTWTTKHKNVLYNYYRKANAIDEVFPLIDRFYDSGYKTICEWTCASIYLLCDLFDIQTNILLQSTLEYDRKFSKSDLVLEICKTLDADVYYSGRGGSVRYLDQNKFKENGVTIVFQDFVHPEYEQIHSESFISGVSSLDILFNCGIEVSKQLFWENVKKKKLYDGLRKNSF